MSDQMADAMAGTTVIALLTIVCVCLGWPIIERIMSKHHP